MWISRTRSGRERLRISVQFSQPRKSFSTSRWRAWTWVPMAPSARRTRSESAARKRLMLRLSNLGSRVCALGFRLSGLGAERAERRPPGGAHAEDVADRVGEVGAVEGIEVELVDSLGVEVAALLGGGGGGDELAGARVVVEPLEEAGEPGRDAGAARLG